MHRVRDVRRVEIRDLTFLGRVGWTDIVAEPGRGTAVRTSVSSRDPTNRLTTYRGITLQDVTDQRVGRFAVQPGKGTLAGPRVQESGLRRPRRLRTMRRSARARTASPGCSRTRAPGRACSS